MLISDDGVGRVTRLPGVMPQLTDALELMRLCVEGPVSKVETDDLKSVEDPLESEPECGSSVQVVSVQSLPAPDWQF